MDFRPFLTLCDLPEFYFLALGDVGLSPRLPLHDLLLHSPGGCVLPFDGGDARAGVLHREQDVFLHRGIDGRLGDVQ